MFARPTSSVVESTLSPSPVPTPSRDPLMSITATRTSAVTPSRVSRSAAPATRIAAPLTDLLSEVLSSRTSSSSLSMLSSPRSLQSSTVGEDLRMARWMLTIRFPVRNSLTLRLSLISSRANTATTQVHGLISPPTRTTPSSLPVSTGTSPTTITSLSGTTTL